MKLIIHGIGGRMGQVTYALCQKHYSDAEAVAGIDLLQAPALDIPVYSSFADVKEEADCLIDFSHHSLTGQVLDFCRARKMPLVLCTTGQTAEELAMIDAASREIPVFFSANMSIGVALLCRLACLTAAAMPDADIEIVETHHNRKLDAPSGTALMLARAIQTVRTGARLVMGRSGQAKREQGDIGMHAIRVGNEVGTHEVIVGTDSQTVTLKHQAHTRDLFAEGALSAASFLMGKTAGRYTMQEMIP